MPIQSEAAKKEEQRNQKCSSIWLSQLKKRKAISLAAR